MIIIIKLELNVKLIIVNVKLIKLVNIIIRELI